MKPSGTLARLAPLALAAVVAVPFAQERVSRKEPATFDDVHGAIAQAFRAGEFGRALAKTRELIGVIAPRLTEAILGAMPPAPEGFTIQPQPERNQQQQQNPMLSALTAGIGAVVEQRYTGPNGARVQVTVTAESPLVQMFGMWVSNPAVLGPGAELIKYDEYDAILRKEGSGWALQMVIGTSLVEAKGQGEGVDDELLLKMFTQARVDGLAKVLLG